MRNAIHSRCFVTLFTLVVVAGISPALSAAGWGNLKGHFVVDGAPPAKQSLNINKDVEYCTQHDPQDESVMVADDGSFQGVIVYLRLGRGESVEVHPDYKAELSEPVVLDNKGCAFHSHVTLVRVGQPFILKNSDSVGHNTNASLRANGNFNVIIAAGTEHEMAFTKEERLPMPVNCNIHPWMSGHVLIRDDPYMAVSADDGTFEIKNIPAGEHEFQFWQERIGYLKDCKYNSGALDRRGRGEFTIADGQTIDLGDIKVPASLIE